MASARPNSSQLQPLARQIKQWAAELGFQQVGITDIDLSAYEPHLQRWLAQGLQGELDYMSRHGHKRSRPAELLPGTLRAISARMDYLTTTARDDENARDAHHARVSRYALGRDYHKLMRKRLAQLADKIDQAARQLTGTDAGHQYRAFVDSAPVLERALAEKAGLGWMGKNTMLMNRQAGSYFFLGEIYTNLPLPTDSPANTNYCGTCQACLDACPTQAFVAPYVLDARKCISYLTIELKGSIPEALRPAIGNRIFGCDECQSACPWNRFAQHSQEDDFNPRHGLDSAQLLALFNWTEEEFLERTAGSAIRRTGYEGWLRNIAVALGNAPHDPAIKSALTERLQHPSELVREHVRWALARQEIIQCG